MDAKAKAARLSVGSNSLLVALKIVAGLVSGSISVMSEAIHSGIDLLAAIIAFFSVRLASKPADSEHEYGHGKVENISGTVEAVLIIIAAIWIIVEAVAKLLGRQTVSMPTWGIVVMTISVVVNTLVSRHLFQVAKATDSVALEADALHLSTDVYTSLAVLAGLVIIYFTDWHFIDPLAAIGVAVLIVKAAWDMTKEAFLPLVDTSLPAEEEQAIIGIIERYSANYIEFHRLRTRKAGSERHIDLHLVVPGESHIDRVHDLCELIERDIEERFPRSQVLIHVEPSSRLAPGQPGSLRDGGKHE